MLITFFRRQMDKQIEPLPGTADKASSGNKRREERRCAFLEAAAKLFLGKGYAATGLADIVRVSGGSLSTLYGLFGSKSGLFKALIEDRRDVVVNQFAGIDFSCLSVEQSLFEIGRRWFGLMMSADAMGVVRLIVAEGRVSPELAETFWASGPQRCCGMVEASMLSLMEAGQLRAADPKVASEHFFSLIKGEPFFHKLLNLPVDDSPEALDAHVQRAVAAFLCMYRP